MFEIPTYVEAGGQSYAITKKGDFRMVLDCFAALNDETLEKEERLIAALIIFYEDLNDVEDVVNCDDLEALVEGMYKFFNVVIPMELEIKSIIISLIGNKTSS